MNVTAAPPARGRRLVAVSGAVLAIVVALVAVNAISVALFPRTDSIEIVNRSGGALDDVRLIGPDERGVARFQRIPADESVVAKGTGTGAFSLVYSDAKGRWIGRDAVRFDEDDIRGTNPIALVVEDGRVGRTAVVPNR